MKQGDWMHGTRGAADGKGPPGRGQALTGHGYNDFEASEEYGLVAGGINPRAPGYRAVISLSIRRNRPALQATLQQSQRRGMPRKIQFMSTKKANLPAIE
jgi:hypothetical protein